MEFFSKLMTFIGVREQKVDILKELPTEISQIILSKLDTQSLYNASQVSRTWLSLCKSTSNLRQRIRRHIRPNKLSQVISKTPKRTITHPSKPLITVSQVLIPM